MKLALFLLIFIPSITFSATISSITFKGLTKTKPEFLHQIIKCKVGQTFDTVQIKKDAQSLRNLNLFFSVKSSFKLNSTDNYDLSFTIEEAKYIFPLISIAGFKSQLKVQAGVNNINWRGRNQTIGFLYQFYDRHSLSLYQKTPHHKNGKTGHEISVAKYSTVEPLYFDTIKSDFNFDNYSLDISGKYWLNDYLNVNIGGMLMYENYLERDNNYIDLVGMKFSFFKYQVKSSFECNYVNQFFEFFDGFKSKLYIEMIHTKDYPMASFIKFTTQTNYYKKLGYRGNLAINHSFGVATNNDSPFSPFVLDGFINIRGIGNRVSRGTAENILNIEFRYSILNKKHFTIQTVAFTDVGSLRQAGDDLNSVFYANNINYYSGLGLRLHSKYFYKAIFRIDYSINLQNLNQGGLTFGLGHFF